MLVDPATLSDAERERAGAARYPETLGAALDALERDEVLTGAIGEVLTASVHRGFGAIRGLGRWTRRRTAATKY